MKALVTGAAGFIGSHLCERVLGDGWEVVGVDNFDDFYDPQIKRQNITGCLKNKNFYLIEADIRDGNAMDKAVGNGVEIIIHLAARAGVRPSIAQPLLYADVNVNGTMVLLEAAKKHKVGKFVFGSSSSVYGNNKKVPFSEDDNVDFPISPYAATKKAGELICHTYHHLYGLCVTCLRFFTVYGPRQRPDLAIHKFAKLIEQDKLVPVYGDGSMMRDFTYIDDIIDGVVAAINRLTSHARPERSRGESRLSAVAPALHSTQCGGGSAKAETSSHGFNIYNLGRASPISVNDLVAGLEKALGKKAVKEYLPAQPGDVERTYADITKAERELGYKPKTTIEEGLARFTAWLRINL
jgi:UDP-glucuronate 4-epimerase